MEDCVPIPRNFDRLTEFSHRLAQIKFIIFELFCMGSFFYVLYLVVKHEFGL